MDEAERFEAAGYLITTIGTLFVGGEEARAKLASKYSKATEAVAEAENVAKVTKAATEAEELAKAGEVAKVSEGLESPQKAGKVISKGTQTLEEAGKVEEVAGDVAKVTEGTGKTNLKSVDDIIKSVENGEIKLSNNIQKGNYGEMKMDAYFERQGYKRISLNKVADLDTPTHQGIDGVYYNPDGHPPYVIGEAKYGSSRLGNTLDGPQMSDDWIYGSNRLSNAVDKATYDDILLEGYEKNLFILTKMES